MKGRRGRCLVIAVAISASAGLAQIVSGRSLVFAHVSVVDVESGVARDDQTVVIVGNRIAEVGLADRVRVPPGGQVIDARGKFLIPGLWDMHAHGVFSADLFILHAAHGVTGIRHMAGPLTEATGFRRAGPSELREYPMRIRVGALSGPGLDGFESYPQFPGVWSLVSGPDDARKAVAAVHAARMDFVKIHTQMSRETWRAAVTEAKALGIPFAGHVPYAVSPAEAADAGQKSIEHLTGVPIACSSEEAEIRRSLSPLQPGAAGTAPRIEAATGQGALATFSQEKCQAIAQRFARAGTWQVPTFEVRIDRPVDHAPIHWSSDGKGWYVSSTPTYPAGTELVNVNLEGVSRVMLTQDARGRMSAIAAPDGRHIALTYTSAVTNVWMLKGF